LSDEIGVKQVARLGIPYYSPQQSDKSRFGGAESGKPDPPGLYRRSSQPEVADRYHADPLLGRQAVTGRSYGLL